jgi:hypothetical protein
LEESSLWQEDRIGLRELAARGGLLLRRCPGRHMHFTLDWFEAEIVRPFLDVPAADSGPAVAAKAAAEEGVARER